MRAVYSNLSRYFRYQVSKVIFLSICVKKIKSADEPGSSIIGKCETGRDIRCQSLCVFLTRTNQDLWALSTA